MSNQKKQNELIVHWKSLISCLIVSLCAFQFGFDATVIGGLQAIPGFLQVFGYKDHKSPIGYNISTVRQQLISSLVTLGSFITSATSGLIAKFIGRKPSLWIACILCLISVIIMMTTTSIGALYFARLVMGLSNGLFDTFSQLYILECAPAKYRGMMMGFLTYWVTFGALIGTIVDNFSVKIGGKKSYIIPLGVMLIVPGFLAIAVFFIPESPRWLLQMNKEEDAQKALKRLRPPTESIEKELADMKFAMDSESALTKKTEIIELWRSSVNRRRTLLAISGVSLQVACGASFIIVYSTYFFEMAGIGRAFEDTCIMAGIGSFFLLVNSAIITKYGRRRVFLGWGLIFGGIAQLIMAAVYTAYPKTKLAGKVTVSCSIINLVFYNTMIATYARLCGGELPSQNLRSYTLGIATSIGFVLGWLVSFTAPYFINPASLNWGPKYGYIWAASSAIGAIWVWLFLPEVKDRTFEEIDEMFETRLPARKFRGHHCTRSVSISAEVEKSKQQPVATHKEVVSSSNENFTSEAHAMKSIV